MSKSKKRLQRLCKKPGPKDFTWEELLPIMEEAGFSLDSDGGGSHFTFEHVSGATAMIPRPHSPSVLKQYQIIAAIDALKTVGAIDDTGESNG